jgi:hypothetical protein
LEIFIQWLLDVIAKWKNVNVYFDATDRLRAPGCTHQLERNESKCHYMSICPIKSDSVCLRRDLDHEHCVITLSKRFLMMKIFIDHPEKPIIAQQKTDPQRLPKVKTETQSVSTEHMMAEPAHMPSKREKSK